MEHIDLFVLHQIRANLFNIFSKKEDQKYYVAASELLTTLEHFLMQDLYGFTFEKDESII